MFVGHLDLFSHEVIVFCPFFLIGFLVLLLTDLKAFFCIEYIRVGQISFSCVRVPLHSFTGAVINIILNFNIAPLILSVH